MNCSEGAHFHNIYGCIEQIPYAPARLFSIPTENTIIVFMIATAIMVLVWAIHKNEP